MSGSPRAALLAYAQPLQGARLLVTPSRLQYSAEETGSMEILRFVNAPGAELKRRDQTSNAQLPSVYLRVDQYISTLLVSVEHEPRHYRVTTLGYEYAILDQQQREIISFHWHPGRRSHEHDSHAHIGSAVIDSNAASLGKTFSRFHIPTGQVSLVRIVRMLLTEFQAVPNRRDW